MEVILYIELNAFAIVILFLINLNIHLKNKKHLFEEKLFLSLLKINVLILVMDSFTWLFDGKDWPHIKVILITITSIYYILNPLTSFMWSIYAHFYIYRSERRLKKILLPMLLPLVLNTVLTILSIFQHFYFYIDKEHIYHRGSLFLVMACISYLYLAYTFLLIIKNHKTIQRTHFIPILAFAIPPVIAGILQLMFYGLSLIWISMTISILIVFLNTQTEQLCTDYLTGLFNRRQLDNFLREQFEKDSAKSLAGILIDIDNFKEINDKYGHSMGDTALRYTSQILKDSFCKKEFVFRYGGDEFVVITEIDHKSELDKALLNLNQHVTEFNRKNIAPYQINFSIGADFISAPYNMSSQDFLKHIDHLMYIDKQK